MRAFLPRVVRDWLEQSRGAAVSAPSSTLPLPWWGRALTTTDKAVLTELEASGQRLLALFAQPGWQDVERMLDDWQRRYSDQAGRLGQTLQDNAQGQLVLQEQDTPADDRRRLIAAAQAAALRGVLAELKQRAQVPALIRRREQQAMREDSGELV